MTKLSVRHLLGIKNLNENDINTILDTAAQFKEVINRPIKKVPSLRDITIANVFFENSIPLARRRVTSMALPHGPRSAVIRDVHPRTCPGRAERQAAP